MGAAAAAVLVVVTAVAMFSGRRLLADPQNKPLASSIDITMTNGSAEAFVDGALVGTTPLTLTLTPGPHKIEFRATAAAPVTAVPTPVAPAAPPAAAPTVASADTASVGYVSVVSKVDVNIFESGRLLGSSQVDRIMIGAGKHDLELVSDAIGYRTTKTVQVAAGKVATITTDIPMGAIALNALPWAEVWMDGAKVGETPIGNLAVAAGRHEVIFRHPELGEKRETVLVTLKGPARLSVDLRSR